MANELVATVLVIWFSVSSPALGLAATTCTMSANECQCAGTDTAGKAFSLDISNHFAYPLVINGTAGSKYHYIYSPCATFACGTAAPNQSNVCWQYTPYPTPQNQLNCGNGPVWSILSLSPLRLNITYQSFAGGYTRTTSALFVENSTATRNSVSAVSAIGNYFSFTVTLGALFCAPDPSNSGCVCRGANFTLDISKLLPYPYVLQGDDGGYEYFYSPCAPITCAATQSAVCQRAHNGMEYNVGVAPVWSVHNISPINFTINYTVPGSPRNTVVNFYQNPAAQFNTTTKVVEYPTNVYMFDITLAPKPTCTPDPVYGGCVCRGASFTLDISETFKYPFSIPGVGNKYKYSFSPCSPAPCGGSYATVCQKDLTSGTENICGVNAAWTIYTLHPLNFTISYTVPGSSRQTLVKFDRREGLQNFSTAVAEHLMNSYNFNITMAVGQGSSYWNKAMKKPSTLFFFKNGLPHETNKHKPL
ncbi:hypothetical protein EMCRGX_G008399 [Ephydatia muelleri]